MMAKTIRTALVCVAAMLSLAIAARAEPHHHHRRAAYGDSPVYWGVERRVRTYRDCCGRWTRLNPREASIRQVNPRLRARSDGRLLEEVGTPPPRQPDVVVVWPDGSNAGPVIPPPYFRWFGGRQGYHHARPLNGSGARGSSGSGYQKRGR